MKSIQYTSVAIATIIGFANISGASALALPGPSLQSQMQRQSVIDAQYASTKIQTANEQALEAIRLRNAAKLSNSATSTEENTTLSSAQASEDFLKSAEREAALNRTVTRKTSGFNTISTPAIAQTIVANNPAPNATELAQNFAKNQNPTSRQVGNIDMARVELAWLSWVNMARAEKGLAPYTTHSALSTTAQEWAEFSANRGYTTHGRPGDGCTGATNYVCYNYNAIDQWLKDRGVNATNVNRSTHTENVGFGGFKCLDSDCTDEAIAAIKSTYNFFYKEKTYNGVHYRTMVNPNFKHLGLGVSVKNGKYYLAAHYSTPLK